MIVSLTTPEQHYERMTPYAMGREQTGDNSQGRRREGGKQVKYGGEPQNKENGAVQGELDAVTGREIVSAGEHRERGFTILPARCLHAMH